MKILVTGGLGLIGHHVVEKLEAMGHDVVIVDNRTNYGFIDPAQIRYLIDERMKNIKTKFIYPIDISLNPNMDWIFETHKPELVIHLASFPRQKVVNNDPVKGSKTMSEGLLVLLELCKKYKTEKFVYISSSMVYGDFTDDVTEEAVCNPIGQYGILKLAGEHLVKDYSRRGIIKHVIIRPSAVYGPLDVEDRVISKFMLAAMRGEHLKVNGQNEKLDFTYVDDAADGIVKAALSTNTNNKTYNITKSHSHSLYDAAVIATKLARNGTIELREKDEDFPSRGALNIDAARRDFGFDPKVDVEEGFQIYYDWLKSSSYFNK